MQDGGRALEGPRREPWGWRAWSRKQRGTTLPWSPRARNTKRCLCLLPGLPPLCLVPPPATSRPAAQEVLLTPTHLALVLEYEAGGSAADFVAQQVGTPSCALSGGGGH